MSNTSDPKIHEGRNIKRLREMLGVKQESLAEALGFNQQKISLLEQKETVDPEVLESVAKFLKIPVDAIKKFNEEMAINIISNTFNDHAVNMNYQCTFNPIDKIVQLYDEKVALYEKMLKERNDLLQKFIEKNS
ncbi:MAG TPA: helix-turn-helix transcriptional regulator [Chitinophagaceae bacterium]|nr:helix-turn-helix transcriptional regulator [Chitinophagaceae bacterium]